MFLKKSVAVIVPAFNEEKLIVQVIETMPRFVDQIVVVNDASSDRTKDAVQTYAGRYKRKLLLINHEQNKGVGGAIATGYKWALENDVDIAVVMAGDGQMDPVDLASLVDPVAKGLTDYAKGNRLITKQAYRQIPKSRYFGNAALSLFTKIASGYWHVADSQCGYTAINKAALKLIEWDRMYKRYGQPNDLLVKLNIANMRVKDVPVKPVYNIGERSGIKIHKVIFTIGWLVIRLFLFRLWEKYVIRDFHPLVFFYAFGTFLAFLSVPLLVRFAYFWMVYDETPKVNFLAWMFCTIMAAQFILFAMWFDMESNKDLKS